MEAWNLDANQIKDPRQLDGFHLVTTSAVTEFMERRDHDSKFFIVAPKGIGKTLLLKCKSVQYRKQKSEFTCVPENELCERLTPAGADIAFAQDDIPPFSTTSHWAEIWSLCLMSVILKRLQKPLPNELEDMFGDAHSANDLLNILLRERRNLYLYAPLISKTLSPAIGNIRKSIAVFIDNVDEFMDKHVGPRRRDWERPGGKSLGALSERVWVSAQLGLMEAAKAINARNAHIKIFASIRLEAFNSDNSPTHTQTRDVCTILKYNDTELKQIFTGNIQLMREDDLADPSNETPIDRFLGFHNVQHPFVTEPDGNPRCEGVFRYILRHTLRRPRELLWMGSEIAKIPVANRDVSTVSRRINQMSTEILQQYKNEIVPFWDENESATLVSAFKTNIIGKDILNRITANTPVCCDAVAAFYRRGLLGVIHSKDWGAELIQTFLPAAEHLFNSNETLPASTHYLLHPCLEEEFKRVHGDKFKFDEHNIIGYDYPFAPNGTIRKKKTAKRPDHILHLTIKDQTVIVDGNVLNPKLDLLHFGLLLALARFFQSKHAAFSLKDLLPVCGKAYQDCLAEVRKREPEYEPNDIGKRIKAYGGGNAQPLSNHLQALGEALGKGKKATQTAEQNTLSAAVINCKKMKEFSSWKITTD